MTLLLAPLLVVQASNPTLVPTVQDVWAQDLRLAQAQETAAPAGESPPAEPAEGTAPDDASKALAQNAPSSLTAARRIAVYEFERQGVDPNIATVVNDSLIAEIRKLQSVSAIGMDEIQDMLSHEANKQILGCEADDSCLAEIAGALGVDDIITGKLSKVGDNHVLLLRRIDQGKAKVMGVFNKRLKAGSGQEFLLSIGPAVETLFPDRALRQGTKRGVPEKVALRLDPPPLPPVAFWSAVGVTGASLAASGLFGLLALAAKGAHDSEIQAARDNNRKADGGLLYNDGYADQYSNNVILSYGFLGGAVAAAATAGVMYLFTDFEGYGDADTK